MMLITPATGRLKEYTVSSPNIKCKELEAFEKKLYNMVNSLKHRRSTDDFQKKMKQDISSVNSSPDVFLFSSKSNNIYKESPEQYRTHLKENVTKI